MNFEIVISFVLATSALAISPGPDNIYVLVQSISHGKKYGLATVAGLMTGCIIHTSFVAFGVSALIQQSDMLFLVLKIGGACYLFYLAYKVWKADAEIHFSEEESDKKSLQSLYKQGFFMNLLNPKVAIFFLAFFPAFLFSETVSAVIQFYILGGIFIIVSFLIFGSIAVLSSYISNYLRQHKNTGKILKVLQIIVFILIGVFILFSEK